MLNYWISQVIIVIAYIILSIGLRRKERIQILIFSSIYQGLIVISYTLLFGIMGVIASTISLLRNFLFIYNEKKGKNNSLWIFALFNVITIILTIIFYKSIVDIFPCIFALVGTYSYWRTSTKVTRLGNLVVSGCSVIYAIPLSSWFTVICETYLIINTIIGYIKHELHH